MANVLLGTIKKQASTFIHDKYNDARLILTDVTEAELLAEEATNNEPGSPNAKTMTRIAEASYDLHDYWRIVDVLHRRLNSIDWKQWRQAYKSLVLLDFLLTHGHQDFAEEFDTNIQVIQELGSFKYKDERGIEWGMHMQKRSERVIELLQGGDILNAARLKAVRITNGIQGFGNTSTSPNPSSSIFGTSKSNSPTSVITSPASSTSSVCSGIEIMDEEITQYYSSSPRNRKNNSNGKMKKAQLVNYDWDIAAAKDEKSLISGICSKLGISPRGGQYGIFETLSSDIPHAKKRLDNARLNRQFSIG